MNLPTSFVSSKDFDIFASDSYSAVCIPPQPHSLLTFPIGKLLFLLCVFFPHACFYTFATYACIYIEECFTLKHKCYCTYVSFYRLPFFVQYQVFGIYPCQYVASVVHFQLLNRILLHDCTVVPPYPQFLFLQFQLSTVNHGMKILSRRFQK